MKKMTIEDFSNLKHGDKVIKITNGDYRTLYYVGVMPTSDNHFIFSKGGDTEIFRYYENHGGANFINWYIGEYDPEFIGNVLVKNMEGQISGINYTYLNKEDLSVLSVSRDELLGLMNDLGNGVGWTESSYRICEFLGIDPTDGV